MADGTLPVIDSGLSPMAQPYRYRVLFSEEYLKERELEFYTAQKSGAVEDFDEVVSKAGGRLKYFQALYEEILLQSCQQTLSTYIIYAGDYRYEERAQGPDEGVYTALGCQVYLMPDVDFLASSDSLKELISVQDTQPVTPERINHLVEAELEQMRASKSMEQEKKHPLGGAVVVEEGDVALVTLKPTIDGKPWTQGQITNNKLRVAAGQVHPEELRQKLLGLGQGTHMLTFTLSEAFGPSLAGKQVTAVCIVHAVLTYALPPWDDTLASEFGGSTLAELRDRTYTKVRGRLEKEWKLRVGNEAVSKLITLGNFDPIPEVFVVTQAKKVLAQQKMQAKGDINTLLKHYRVPDEQALLGMLCHQTEAELVHVAGLVAYGAQFAGLVPSLRSLQDFLQAAVDHLLAHNTTVVVPTSLGLQDENQLEQLAG